MNYLKKKLISIGNVEKYEIKNISLVLLLIGPTLFIFSYFINNYGNDTVKIKGAREIFAFLFFLVGILPLLFKNKFLTIYGWIIFALMLSFGHYLIVNMYINNFIIRFLLGFYTFTFGSVLLFNNRMFTNFFMITIFIHLLQKLSISEVDPILYNSIVSSFTILTLFTFVILNGATRYRNEIVSLNKNLEKIVKKRTSEIIENAKDLEEKNKDLEEFAFIVSHDLKSPLSNILALASWLKEDLNSHNIPAEKSNLELIEKQISQMDLIIKGVLNYSLQNEVSSNNKPVDLNILVTELKALYHVKNCIITIKNKLPIVQINKSQILQVFQNLIQNAIKYNDKKVCEIEIDVIKKEGMYVFSIKDNGIGIDKKYHKKIFKLFQKLEVKKDVDSTGIGLSLVKKIIERNKGKVYLKSTVNKGTTFFFTLPV